MVRAKLPTLDQAVMVDLYSLAVDPENPKVHSRDSVARIKQSILEVGLVQPFLARASDRVVAGDGNGRWLACHELLQEGYALGGASGREVPVLFGHWDETTWPLVALTLNNLKAQPVPSKLGSLVADLKTRMSVQKVRATGVHPAIVEPPVLDKEAMARIKADLEASDKPVVLRLSPPVWSRYLEWRADLDNTTARRLTDTEVLDLLLEALKGAPVT